MGVNTFQNNESSCLIVGLVDWIPGLTQTAHKLKCLIHCRIEGCSLSHCWPLFPRVKVTCIFNKGAKRWNPWAQ